MDRQNENNLHKFSEANSKIDEHQRKLEFIEQTIANMKKRISEVQKTSRDNASKLF